MPKKLNFNNAQSFGERMAVLRNARAPLSGISPEKPEYLKLNKKSKAVDYRLLDVGDQNNANTIR
jgi:peroxiredoxin